MKRIAAIDFGQKRLGFAISDEKKRMALPWMVAEAGKDPVAAAVKAMGPRLKEIEKIVVGYPLLMTGKVGPMAEMARKFAEEIEKATGIPIVLWDERLSSKEAERGRLELNRKERSKTIDSAAATIFLQSYLEAHSR